MFQIKTIKYSSKDRAILYKEQNNFIGADFCVKISLKNLDRIVKILTLEIFPSFQFGIPTKLLKKKRFCYL